MSDTHEKADLRRELRRLYWQHWSVTKLAREYNLPRTTVDSWRIRDKWDDASPLDRMQEATEARYMMLIMLPNKTPHQFKEIDLLARQQERFARIERYQQPGGNESHLNPNIANRNAAPRKRKPANWFSPEQIEKLKSLLLERMFEYQRRWGRGITLARIRNILKSRQIGATWYFAAEALVNALETGKNKLFLSSSRAQANVFKNYIVNFAREVDVDLKGDPIVLGNNGASLVFISTNFRMAQSFTGDLLFDEYMWTADFETMRKVASAMASQTRYTQTYISTPSSKSHPGYRFWTGEHKNKGRKTGDKIIIDTSHAALRYGAVGADKQWRNIITLEDALSEGCDLFDIDELRDEYPPDEFDNLFGCQFVDDADSVFKFDELQACMVDSWDAWSDYREYSPRPLGNSPVWIGYDPAKSGDGAAISVVAAPRTMLSPFRIISREMFRGMDYEKQVDHIRELTLKFNVEHIGMDTNAVGAVVIEGVRSFFPQVVGDTYSPAFKTAMVYKAREVISAGRLQFDSGCQDIAHAFMAIRKGLTPAGRHVTFYSQRAEGIGHADVAWATMHALMHEPLTAVGTSNLSSVAIY